MSQASKLLNSLSDTDIALYTANPDMEPHIIIGEDRIVTVPEELQRIAVQHDNDIETVTFDCPRYWDGHDMSKMAIYINYLPNDGEVGFDIGRNVHVDETNPNIMHFDWTISGNVTINEGRLIFLVDVKGKNGEHWHSELCEDMYVSEGLEAPPIIEIHNPDVLTRILLFHADVVELSEATLKRAAVYVGSGEMPEGFNVQVDPEGESEFEATVRQAAENIVGDVTQEYLQDYAPAVYVGPGEMPEGYSIQIDPEGEEYQGGFVTPQMFGAKGDGVTDDTAAFETMSLNKGLIIIPYGTYLINSTITFEGVCVEGCEATITTNSDAPIYLDIHSNCSIKNLTLQKVCVNTIGEDILIKNVKSVNALSNAFHLQTLTKTPCKRITFEDCVSISAYLSGFNIYTNHNLSTGSRKNAIVEDVNYIRCYALSSGQNLNSFSVGFCIHCNTSLVDRITYDSCVAEDSLESGFHCEWDVNPKNVLFINCKSIDNGKRKDSPVYGAGYLTPLTAKYRNCYASGNLRNFHNGDNYYDFRNADVFTDKYNVKDIVCSYYDSNTTDILLHGPYANVDEMPLIRAGSLDRGGSLVTIENNEIYFNDVEYENAFHYFMSPVMIFNKLKSIKISVDIKALNILDENIESSFARASTVFFDKEFNNLGANGNMEYIRSITNEYQKFDYEFTIDSFPENALYVGLLVGLEGMNSDKTNYCRPCFKNIVMYQ